MVTVLHTEASGGLGGQELRILHEAVGMRARGHQIVFAAKTNGGLAKVASKAGFTVYELPWQKKYALSDLWRLLRIMRRHQVQIVNTHSSWDAWLGGIAGRIAGKHLVRTRHLSTAIRTGWNSRILYGKLADAVVTTCEITAQAICKQANIPSSRCFSVPTGVDPSQVVALPEEIQKIREAYGLSTEHVVVGTACVLRSWKGVVHLLEAASLLKKYQQLRILIVGDGPAWGKLHGRVAELELGNRVIFTGHLENPYPAMAAMNAFALLSIAHEGVSQAVLQAAYLGRPLITTQTGGLAEICLDGQTGLLCEVNNPPSVAQAIETLLLDAPRRQAMGERAKQLVEASFTMQQTLDSIDKLYSSFDVPRRSFN